MSTLVTNELFAQPGHRDDVTNLLLEILGESLQHDGCETIRILRDQDDPDHVAGLTQWTERHNFEDSSRGVRSAASPTPLCCLACGGGPRMLMASEWSYLGNELDDVPRRATVGIQIGIVDR
jgi:quinol monooxygenase YgiN